MARTVAAARSPVVFFTADGVQIDVPMSSLYFDNGELVTDRWSGQLLQWLKYQARLGRIVATPDAPTPPAFRVTAADAHAGTYGNRIQISTTPAATSTKDGNVDVMVSATDSYPDVTVAQLAGLLGEPGSPGSKPGLLHVTGNPASAPEPSTGMVTEAPAWTWKLTSGTPTLKLEPRVSGTAFKAGQVRVRVDKGSTTDTFTLVVTWSAKATDVDPGDPNAKCSPTFDFLVKIEAVDGTFRRPRAGTMSLAGGREPAAATTANAIVLAED